LFFETKNLKVSMFVHAVVFPTQVTEDATPLLGGSPRLSYLTVQPAQMERRRRLDPGLVSQIFQIRLDFLKEAGVRDDTSADVLMRGYAASPLVSVSCSLFFFKKAPNTYSTFYKPTSRLVGGW